MLNTTPPSKMTQRELALALLEESGGWVPIWRFVGEHVVRGQVRLFSYKVPARLTELYQDGFVDRRRVKGLSGSHYFEYRIKKGK